MIHGSAGWCRPPLDLELSENDVHIWRAFLDLPLCRLEHLRRTLAPDELNRAERFHFPVDRARFVAARGLLRAISSAYLGVEPDELRFRYDRFGKPTLAWLSGRVKLNFSVSHSGTIALYAITREQPVGVDVELVRDDLVWEPIAARFYSPVENAFLNALPSATKREAFFAFWTCKEACLKATGKGLSLGLDQFVVSVSGGNEARLLYVKDESDAASDWHLQMLAPGDGYVAALAVRGRNPCIACWQRD